MAGSRGDNWGFIGTEKPGAIFQPDRSDLGHAMVPHDGWAAGTSVSTGWKAWKIFYNPTGFTID
jgi:hypothetical protein